MNWIECLGSVRVSIAVGVAYDTDLRLAQRLMIEAATESKRVLADPAPFTHLHRHRTRNDVAAREIVDPLDTTVVRLGRFLRPARDLFQGGRHPRRNAVDELEQRSQELQELFGLLGRVVEELPGSGLLEFVHALADHLVDRDPRRSDLGQDLHPAGRRRPQAHPRCPCQVGPGRRCKLSRSWAQ